MFCCYLKNTSIVSSLALLMCCFVVGDNCYEVEAIQSDDMYKLQARGNLIMKLSLDEIQLAQAGSLTMIANWPLMSLRRYSSENGVFTIEMGRRSPRGQGIYLFKTIQDSELFDKVQSLIKRAATAPQHTLMCKDLSVGNDSLRDDVPGASSFGFNIDNRPPAPLPLVNYPAPPLPPKDNVLDDVESGGIRLTYHLVTKADLRHRQQTLLAKVRKCKPCTITVTVVMSYIIQIFCCFLVISSAITRY